MVDFNAIIDFMKEKHKNHPFAGIDHVTRVHDLCVELAKGLDVDLEILKTAAYLHDIAVPIYGPQDHNSKAQDIIEPQLQRWGLPAEKNNAVYEAIFSHTRYADVKPISLEAKILKDADGLDYIGAIGIMRGVIREFNAKRYNGNISDFGTIIMEKLYTTVDNTFSTEKGKNMAMVRIQYIKGFIQTVIKESKLQA